MRELEPAGSHENSENRLALEISHLIELRKEKRK
jgi:hypothetical protein